MNYQCESQCTTNDECNPQETCQLCKNDEVLGFQYCAHAGLVDGCGTALLPASCAGHCESQGGRCEGPNPNCDAPFCEDIKAGIFLI